MPLGAQFNSSGQFKILLTYRTAYKSGKTKFHLVPDSEVTASKHITHTK